jgi:hypothetical protein
LPNGRARGKPRQRESGQRGFGRGRDDDGADERRNPVQGDGAVGIPVRAGVRGEEGEARREGTDRRSPQASGVRRSGEWPQLSRREEFALERDRKPALVGLRQQRTHADLDVGEDGQDRLGREEAPGEAIKFGDG